MRDIICCSASGSKISWASPENVMHSLPFHIQQQLSFILNHLWGTVGKLHLITINIPLNKRISFFACKFAEDGLPECKQNTQHAEGARGRDSGCRPPCYENRHVTSVSIFICEMLKDMPLCSFHPVIYTCAVSISLSLPDVILHFRQSDWGQSFLRSPLKSVSSWLPSSPFPQLLVFTSKPQCCP